VWARRTDNSSFRAYAADVAARAYALDGDSRACMRELAHARAELAADAPAADDGSLTYFYGEGLLASTESGCRLRLGDPRGAAEHAERSLDLIEPSFVRNQALSTLHLSSAYAQVKEIDQAASALAEAAELAARNRSARLTERLIQVRAELRPWDTTRPVRDLDERLWSYGLA
jgi:hypothetical protein